MNTLIILHCLTIRCPALPWFLCISPSIYITLSHTLCLSLRITQLGLLSESRYNYRNDSRRISFQLVLSLIAGGVLRVLQIARAVVDMTIHKILVITPVKANPSWPYYCDQSTPLHLRQNKLHCVQKKHPLTFSFIFKWIMGGFKQKLQWIYPRKSRFWQFRN